VRRTVAILQHWPDFKRRRHATQATISNYVPGLAVLGSRDADILHDSRQATVRSTS
jgi:hypothetical protein